MGDELDVVVIGAGVAGLAALHLLRSHGLRVRTVDAADDVGGAWWWHGYPGSRLDTEGACYQYFFREDLVRDWGWSERFPAGYEVLRWLRFVADKTWKTFGDLGKIRVGVKTCADKIFIRSDWDSLPESQQPELLRPLTTHHIAGRFRSIRPQKAREILYPHEVVQGQRQPVDLAGYPHSRAYLESHRAALEGRTYVLEAGRRWYEIWVPQDPAAWSAPKLVFRDISERPTFWIDLDGSIVNGDCYWMVAERQADNDLIWLAAAVANSTFIEAFYDHRFNNKLYGGRRRFITQYVELFPLPNPNTPLALEITKLAKEIYDAGGSQEAAVLETKLDPLIWQAFGLSNEKARW